MFLIKLIADSNHFQRFSARNVPDYFRQLLRPTDFYPSGLKTCKKRDDDDDNDDYDDDDADADDDDDDDGRVGDGGGGGSIIHYYTLLTD